jgi:voltage-gated potassium channel
MTDSCSSLVKNKPLAVLRALLAGLYHGESKSAVRFRYGLLGLDIATLLFLFLSSFYYGSPLVEMGDAVFGVLILADILIRLWLSSNRMAFLISPYGIADVLTVISLLLPLLGENLAFLRAIRMLRLFRSYEMMARLRRDFPFFSHHQDVIVSVTNLLVFIFVMTAIVFESQVGHNPAINNYVDALYFTVTTLTTTGFGDITLQGDSGKMIAVVIMIFGVSLFIRLIRTVFRPPKLRFTCPQCGLFMHDRDAVHCKACGHLLNIPDEGAY